MEYRTVSRLISGITVTRDSRLAEGTSSLRSNKKELQKDHEK